MRSCRILDIIPHPSVVNKIETGKQDTGDVGSGDGDGEAGADKRGSVAGKGAAPKSGAAKGGKDEKKGKEDKKDKVKGSGGGEAESNEVELIEIRNKQVDYGTVMAFDMTSAVVKSVTTLKLFNVGLSATSLELLAQTLEESNIMTLHLDFNRYTNVLTNQRILEWIEKCHGKADAEAIASATKVPSRPGSRQSEGAGSTVRSRPPSSMKKGGTGSVAQSQTDKDGASTVDKDKPLQDSDSTQSLAQGGSSHSSASGDVAQNNMDSDVVYTEGPHQFSLLFTATSPLCVLSLRDVGLGNQDMEDIMTRLKTNTRLMSLNVSNNKITEACIPSISDMLQANKTLTCLNLSYNKLGGKLKELVEAFLATEIKGDISAYKATGKNVLALKARSFRDCNTTLRLLDLSFTGVTEEDAFAVASLFKDVTDVQEAVRKAMMTEEELAAEKERADAEVTAATAAAAAAPVKGGKADKGKAAAAAVPGLAEGSVAEVNAAGFGNSRHKLDVVNLHGNQVATLHTVLVDCLNTTAKIRMETSVSPTA